MRHLMG